MSIIRSLPEGRVSLRVAMVGPQSVFVKKSTVITKPSHWTLSIFVRVPKATVLPINSSITQKDNQHFQQEYCAGIQNPLLR